MKKMTHRLRKNFLYVTGILILTLVFTACSKDNENEPQEDKSVLMLVNLAPDQNSILPRMGSTILIPSGMTYPSNTEAYLDIVPGMQTIKMFSSASEADPFLSTIHTFEKNNAYSLFIIGVGSGHEAVITRDTISQSQIASGKSYIRFINAIPGTSAQPTVKITAGANDIFEVSGVPFGAVSKFRAADAGPIKVTVNNGDDIDITKDLTTFNGSVYTITISGLPDAVDDAKKVQVKLMENGIAR